MAARTSEDPRRVVVQTGGLELCLAAFTLVFTGLGCLPDRWSGPRFWLAAAAVLVRSATLFTNLVMVAVAAVRRESGRKGQTGGRHGAGALRGRRNTDAETLEGALGLTLISVAIGLGLAVAYQVAFVRIQLFISRRSPNVATALTAAGFVVRLSLFAVVLVLLALFTELNIIALAVSFVVLYTILSAVSIQRYLAKAKRDKASRGAGPEGGVVGG